MPKMQTACTLVATEGMIVRTDTPQFRCAQGMLEFLLTNIRSIARLRKAGVRIADMVFRYGGTAASSRKNCTFPRRSG